MQPTINTEGEIMTDKILLAHGSGGKLSRQLTEEIFLPSFTNPFLEPLEDQAIFELPPGRVALTTDSYVVKPLFFPGGNIGRLAICGTVNDLAVGGGSPLFLSAGFILEEGLPFEALKEIVRSMAEAAKEAGVQIVTGDTKVVEKGQADGIYINTAGVGVVPEGLKLGAKGIRPGDKIIINGTLGDHGIAILAAREDLALSPPVKSDAAPLNGLIKELLAAVPSVKALRDPTRGGLATTLNEWAAASGSFISLFEEQISILPQVSGACEIFGFDPLYLANEGKVVIALPETEVDKALKILKSHPYGQNAAVIGEVTEGPPGKVVLKTAIGGQRIIDLLVGEMLPRIC